MRLFSLDHSPYATRVRMLIFHKALTVDIEQPPALLRSEEFKERFALGKIPLLETDNGQIIGESTAIMHFLEGCFPEKPMVPQSTLERAQNEMLERYADLHLGPAVFALFGLSLGGAGKGDAEPQITLLIDEMKKFDRLLGSLPSFYKRSLQTGDLCIAVNIFYALALATQLSNRAILENLPSASQWWSWVQEFEAVSAGLNEMETALRSFMSKKSAE